MLKIPKFHQICATTVGVGTVGAEASSRPLGRSLNLMGRKRETSSRPSWMVRLKGMDLPFLPYKTCTVNGISRKFGVDPTEDADSDDKMGM